MTAGDSPPRSGQTCGTCLHWRPEGVGDRRLGWGQCRRMPPTMPPIHDDKVVHVKLVHVGLWPHTREGDWCGEWQQSALRPEAD